jgi:acyl carrier protein
MSTARTDASLESDVLDEIQRVATEELDLGRAPMLDDDFLRDLHFDSLALTTLAASLEARFGVTLEEDDAVTVATVADLVRLVAHRVGARRP